jgi:hypothetical protein
VKGASKSCEYPVAHQVRSADLDKAVWPDFTQKVALWPEYDMVPAQRMAAESEQRLAQVARRRVAIEQRLAALGEGDRVPPAPGAPDVPRPGPRWRPASRR